jgi:ATP/ADP translocase
VGTIKIPDIRAIILAHFILNRIIIPAKKDVEENNTPKLNQKESIVLQKSQQIMLKSGSHILMGVGVHQKRQ